MHEGIIVGGVIFLIAPILLAIGCLLIKDKERIDEFLKATSILYVIIISLTGMLCIGIYFDENAKFQELTINNCISENDNCDICYDKLHNNISNLFDKLAKREECNVFQQNTKLFTGGE